VTFAAQAGIPMNPFIVVDWYQRGDGPAQVSSDSLEALMSAFDD
jgi:hypothetical protein